MNEKVKRVIFIFACIIILFICFRTGWFIGRTTGDRSADERSPGEVDFIDSRIDLLNREYEERQRIIENQQREFRDSIRNAVDECLGYVDIARTINKRLDDSSIRAISNLTEAVLLIRAGIEERKNLESELDRVSTSLFRLGDMAGDENQ